MFVNQGRVPKLSLLPRSGSTRHLPHSCQFVGAHEGNHWTDDEDPNSGVKSSSGTVDIVQENLHHDQQIRRVGWHQAPGQSPRRSKRSQIFTGNILSIHG